MIVIKQLLLFLIDKYNSINYVDIIDYLIIISTIISHDIIKLYSITYNKYDIILLLDNILLFLFRHFY
jgi:hypothetical protein